MRVLRSAAAAPLSTAAASAGFTPWDASQVLNELAGRGRCARLAAQAAASQLYPARMAGAKHSALAPPAHRLAASAQDPEAVLAGCAGWTGRYVAGYGVPRSAAVAAARSDTSEDRREAGTSGACPPAIMWSWIEDPRDAEILHEAVYHEWATRLSHPVAPGGSETLAEACLRGAGDGSMVSAGLLRVLASSNDAAHRHAVISHPNCPADVLRRVAAHDKTGHLRRQARDRLKQA